MADHKQAGYLRINQLMIQMFDAVEEGAKERLIKLSQHLAEDVEDFVGILLMEADVTDAEIEAACPDDTEELIKDAASADAIRTAKVEE